MEAGYNGMSMEFFASDQAFVISIILLVAGIISFVISKRKKRTALMVISLVVMILAALDLALFAWLAFNWSTPPPEGFEIDPQYEDSMKDAVDVSGNAIDW